jgi:hypothetical protein
MQLKHVLKNQKCPQNKYYLLSLNNQRGFGPFLK